MRTWYNPDPIRSEMSNATHIGSNVGHCESFLIVAAPPFENSLMQTWYNPDPIRSEMSNATHIRSNVGHCESFLIVSAPPFGVCESDLKSYKSETQVGCWNLQQPSGLFTLPKALCFAHLNTP